jgi:MFS family permease
MIVFRVAVFRVADRWGRRLVLVPALVLLAAGFGVLSATPTPPRLTLAAVLLAAGSAALFPTIMTLVVDRVPDRERGVAMGMVSGAFVLVERRRTRNSYHDGQPAVGAPLTEA